MRTELLARIKRDEEASIPKLLVAEMASLPIKAAGLREVLPGIAAEAVREVMRPNG